METLPATISREDALRFVEQEADLAHKRAVLKAAVAAAEQQIAAIEAEQDRLRPLVRDYWLAREAQRGSKRRTFTMADEPGLASVGSVKLRKKPVRLKYVPSDGKFWLWAKENGTAERPFVRVKAKATLTQQERDDLIVMFPGVTWYFEQEPVSSDVQAHYEATGELPPEHELVGGADELVVVSEIGVAKALPAEGAEG